jgi:hypothetical protein
MSELRGESVLRRLRPRRVRSALPHVRAAVLVWQPLGLGKAPFKLYAAAYSREGRSSKTVTVRIKTA